jgi:hypothetical protein
LSSTLSIEMPALEALEKGDSVSVQGNLVLLGEKGRLAGIYIVVKQVMPLRRRSVNKLPQPVRLARAKLL